MIFASKIFNFGVAVFGAIVLLLVLLWPESGNFLPYTNTLESTTLVLKGKGPVSDLAQDIIGFRAMVRQENAYPILGPAVQELGFDWDIKHASTHPPTAFLFVAPIAFLPWNLAAMVWAWLMLGLLALVFRIYGMPWLVALGLTPIALLWPPIATSLGQLTIIWLLGFAIGYRYMRHDYFLSGVGIGLAALTKIIPGLMIILFLSKKRWSAILGIVLVGIASLVIVALLSLNSISQYVQVNRLNSVAMILRDDNSSLLGTGYRSGGWWGVTLVLIFIALVFWTNKKYVSGKTDHFPPTELWMLLNYFAVVLLPVSWIYSLAPLLPVIVFLLSKRKMSTMFVGSCCIIIPFIVPAWGPYSAFPLVLVNVLTGVGLILDALPFRLFTARSLETLFAEPHEFTARVK
jgi:Glycosyltransferase family 87